MFNKIVMVWILTVMVSLYGSNVEKQMIEGKVFYSRYEGNSFYIQTKFKKIDPVESYGEVDYVMMDTPKSVSGSYEVVSYVLKNGKIVIYGNDGSAYRYTLIRVTRDRWVLAVEEDADGIDKHFGYKKTGKETWYLKKPKGYPPLEECKPFEGECFVEAFKFPV